MWNHRTIRRSILAIPGVTALAFFAWFLLDVYRTGDVGTALAVWRGQALVVPCSLEVTAPSEGRPKHLSLPIYNSLNQPVRIVGGTVTCSCVVVHRLPIVLPPRSRTDVPITVRRFSGKRQQDVDTQSIVLYTDLPAVPSMVVRVKMRRASPGTSGLDDRDTAVLDLVYVY